MAQTTDGPLMLEIERAEGVYMYQHNGKKVLDLISGISVSNIGHSHPRVVKAVKDQVDKYMHLMVYGELVQTPQVELAEKLTGILPDGFDSVFFVNSGSEANEGALKVAKRFTGKHKLVSCTKAYHGSTHGALSMLGDEYFKQAYRPLLPEVYHIGFNSFDDLSIIDKQTAAVIIEPIQGEAGLVIPHQGYLKALRTRCNEVGAMLIYDEVQTGFGRTGKMFGFEHSGVIPDIITFAKGMGGGMPLGAFVSSNKIMSTLSHNPVLGHISTFGGHPVSCAAGLALIEELVDKPELIDTAEAKGQLFKTKLEKHPLVKEIRGIGLFLAVDLGTIELQKKVVSLAAERGLLLDPFLFREDCFRIAPPLVITEEQINEACDILNSIFDDLNN